MPADVNPPELARLLDTAERARIQNWSLRAALTRYAQPQPQRASDLIALLRRIESALRPHTAVLEREGPAVWHALGDDSDAGTLDASLIELLRSLNEIDRVGDVLAEWAVDRVPPRPDDLVDGLVAEVGSRLERLGVPHEGRPRPSGRRG